MLTRRVSAGAGRPSSLSVGSLLDDHLWHDVAVHREKSNLTLSVDRVRVFSEIQGVFHRLDLNDKVRDWVMLTVCCLEIGRL